MPIVIGNLKEATHPDTLKAAVAEFISMLTYIFAAEGFAASSRLTSGESTVQSGLIAAAINHSFALYVAVLMATNKSGGHVNPAVTFGAFIGGHITLYRSVLYWIAQLLGSVVACLLLKYSVGDGEVSSFPPTLRNAVVFEIVTTFGLVYTVYATSIDPKRSNSCVIIAPIAVGFTVCANILSGGTLFGAAMNPAGLFGQAIVSWTWNNHWVHWLGTFVGAAIASLVYETIFITNKSDDDWPLPIIICGTNSTEGNSIESLRQKFLPC
ncbi:Aquaporin TIP1-2 [Capsicum annuum]|uniref:Aquaporin TIP1-2 n=1 Tax=Capsicum annuum TaxID=4072 RepID=A0A2G2Z0G5_CAPAN|nr:probable aquaporin TIP1-2 [Capsicum annuum]KAF3681031.1 Aquaporin TIP1-2 [Capsicum annuum]KAF3683133.1 Aquaporin TIP1-2 [Capsicum annuum]PHT75488.1 Aquaporin TIP1-2 [Capsicum annuum]